MTVRPELYLKYLVDMCMIQMYSMALVVETNQVYCRHDCVLLDKPTLEITVRERLDQPLLGVMGMFLLSVFQDCR